MTHAWLNYFAEKSFSFYGSLFKLFIYLKGCATRLALFCAFLNVNESSNSLKTHTNWLRYGFDAWMLSTNLQFFEEQNLSFITRLHIRQNWFYPCLDKSIISPSDWQWKLKHDTLEISPSWCQKGHWWLAEIPARFLVYTLFRHAEGAKIQF